LKPGKIIFDLKVVLSILNMHEVGRSVGGVFI